AANFTYSCPFCFNNYRCIHLSNHAISFQFPSVQFYQWMYKETLLFHKKLLVLYKKLIAVCNAIGEYPIMLSLPLNQSYHLLPPVFILYSDYNCFFYCILFFHYFFYFFRKNIQPSTDHHVLFSANDRKNTFIIHPSKIFNIRTKIG